jgi:hypothetical protein
MSEGNTQSSGGSWADVAKRPAKKVPTVTLSVKAQEQYKASHATPVEDPNHDSRFDPIVFTKPKAPTIIRQQVVQGGGKNKQSQSDVDMRKIERGEIRLPTSDRELAQKIQQYRVAKGWSQDKLNQMCSFKPHTIRDYESMKAVARQNEIDVMKRVLGVNDLHKPKAIKLAPEV